VLYIDVLLNAYFSTYVLSYIRALIHEQRGVHIQFEGTEEKKKERKIMF
jgi:hypothetical protein